MRQKYAYHFLRPIVYFGDSLKMQEEEFHEFLFFDSKSQFTQHVGLFLNWIDEPIDEEFSDLSQRD